MHFKSGAEELAEKGGWKGLLSRIGKAVACCTEANRVGFLARLSGLGFRSAMQRHHDLESSSASYL